MPTRKETTKMLILIPSGIAYNTITRIKSRLNSDKLQKLNNENKDVVEQINKVIAETGKGTIRKAKNAVL